MTRIAVITVAMPVEDKDVLLLKDGISRFVEKEGMNADVDIRVIDVPKDSPEGQG